MGEAELHHRADAESEDQRADAELAAHQDADAERAGLDQGARQAEAPAGLAVEADHQPVARAGAEPGRQIEGTPQADAGHAEQQHRATQPVGFDLRRQEPQAEIGRRADGQHVADGAETGPLLQRDPQQENEQAGDDAGGADGKPGLEAESLVEGVPRPHAEIGAHEKRKAKPPGGEAREQHDPALRGDGENGAHDARETAGEIKSGRNPTSLPPIETSLRG